MNNGYHIDYKYSVTVHSADIYRIAAMRGLAWQCQETGNRQIAVAGAKRDDWKRDGQKVTFYFNKQSYRETFLAQASTLFASGWTKVSESNNQPAPRQS